MMTENSLFRIINAHLNTVKREENSIENGVAYRIREDGKIVGGLVLRINEKTQHNSLELIAKDLVMPLGR